MKLKIVAGILVVGSYVAALGYGIGIKNQNLDSQMENPNPESVIMCASLDSIMDSPNPNLKSADEIQNEIDNLESEGEDKNSIPFFYITDEDRHIIHGIVAGESKGESIRGKKLVAQCIMNAMIRNNWDAETVRIEYKYAGWEPELEKTNPDLWAEVIEAVADVFDNGNLETYEPILYFYAPNYAYSHWHENELTYVLTEGGHKFFKLPGE